MKFGTSKGLDSIINGFNKTLTELDTLINLNNKDKEVKRSQIDQLTSDINALSTETERATKIKNNISNLLEV